MDARSQELAKQIVTPNHLTNGLEAFASVQNTLRQLLAQRCLPDAGLPDAVIQFYLSYLSLLDTNNFTNHIGAGEREGRVFSQLVKTRCYNMTHGIGRSGDLLSDQPKAAGSSLLYKLTNIFVHDILKSVCSVQKLAKTLVVPLCTGMTLHLVMSALTSKAAQANKPVRYVLWSRIDQKTCLKCILTSSLVPIVIPLKDDGPFLRTDVGFMESEMVRVGPENICCVLTTTSCFAPRLPDDLVGVSRLCAKYNVPHVVNNAYGLQSKYIMKRLNAAILNGRVDAVVQSTDKNFLVPVGGAVVTSPSKELIDAIAEIYPGRASASPIVDVFITLLSLGKEGYRDLLKKREACLSMFHSKVTALSNELGEVFLAHPENDISCCMSLSKLPSHTARKTLGADLFRWCVTGPRVVVLDGSEKAPVLGVDLKFTNYGSHSERYSGCEGGYIAMACALGVEEHDVDVFIHKFKEIYLQVLKPPPSAAATEQQ